MMTTEQLERMVQQMRTARHQADIALVQSFNEFDSGYIHGFVHDLNECRDNIPRMETGVNDELSSNKSYWLGYCAALKDRNLYPRATGYGQYLSLVKLMNP